jgi:hypothetical protein
MKCCTDPMPVDQMPGPERIAAVLKKHKMEVLEALAPPSPQRKAKPSANKPPIPAP